MQKLVKKMSEIKNPAKELVGLVGEFNSIETVTVLKDLLNSFNCDNFMVIYHTYFLLFIR